MRVWCLFVGQAHRDSGSLKGQRSPGARSQVVVSHLMRVLETELRSSVTSISALNCRAISGPKLTFSNQMIAYTHAMYKVRVLLLYLPSGQELLPVVAAMI